MTEPQGRRGPPRGSLFYRALLLLLPADVRARHGTEMAWVFDDMKHHARGPLAWLGLHTKAVWDVARLAMKTRTTQGWAWTMDELWSDLKYTGRQLVRKPAFTLVLILTLGLGVGANTAVFSVVEGVVLRPLPYPEPDRLAMVWCQFPTMDLMEFPMSMPEFWDYQDQSDSFESLGGFISEDLTITGGDRPERLRGTYFTHEVFDVLDVAPIMGRIFTAEEDVPGMDQVAVLSEGLWRTRFGSDPGILGQTIVMDGETLTVLGVMPEDFAFPDSDTDLWIPLAADRADPPGRANHFLSVVGRLGPGVTMARAETEMTGLVERFGADESVGHSWLPELHPAFIRPLHEQVVGDVRQSLLVLLGAVGLVLLIACANVANLLLVRGESRQREISIRTAMGAGKGRIVKLLITESVVVAVLGGLAGIGLAILSLKGLAALAPANLPRAEEIGLNGTVLGYAAAMALGSAVFFGLAPALQAARLDIQSSLREEGRGGTATRKRLRLRETLVIAEMAVAVVLLIGAGLLMKSFQNLNSVDPGFVSDGILAFDLSLDDVSYPEPENVTGFYQELLTEMAALPGVSYASSVRTVPLDGSLPPNDIAIENYVRTEEDGPPMNADIQMVDQDYFRLMGIPLLEGRTFDATDNGGSEAVAVIDEVLAERFFQDRSPIGERIHQPGNEFARIVGIVGPVHQEGLDIEPRANLYLLHDQSPRTWFPARAMTVLLRTEVEPLSLTSAVRAAVGQADPNMPVSRITTVEATVADSTARERFGMFLQLVFAGLAMLLAVVGVYGVMSYSVAKRTQEIGIRMALGAEQDKIMKLVVGQGMVLVTLALILGLGAALAVAQVMQSLLFGISPRDAPTYLIAALLLGGVGLVACWLPARRASSVPPQVALRSD